MGGEVGGGGLGRWDGVGRWEGRWDGVGCVKPQGQKIKISSIDF